MEAGWPSNFGLEPRGPRGRPIALGAALAALLFFVFGLLLDNVVGQEDVVGIDAPTSGFMAQHRSGALTTAVKAFTHLGGVAATLAIAAAVIGFLLVRKKSYGAAAFVALLVASGDASYALVKMLVHRPRPAGALLEVSSFSFPSGHALGSTALFLGLAWLVCRRRAGLGGKVAVWLAAALLVALIGLSRLYLGVHYATDVLGGDLLGLAWLATWATALLAWERLGSPHPFHRRSAAKP
ncbi:MAG: hypothetical protein NVSMB32_04020 [Actinomycetota bacterium]